MRPALAAFAVVLALAGCSSGTPTAAAPTVTTTATVTVAAPAVTVMATPTVTVTVTAQPPAPAVAIPTGTWTVGTDIAPGVYKVIAAITQRCYWAITKTGSNGDDIVANDNVEGGKPQVTLKVGQDFESGVGCGGWQKIG
jgi:putative hemolysin